MRTFLAFVIVLCVVGGLYLLQGPAFFWPDRWEPSQGILLDGHSARLLGAGLLTIAWLGLMAARQAARGDGRAASQRWQIGYFILLLAAMALVSAAFISGEPGPNPDWRGSAVTKSAPQAP